MDYSIRPPAPVSRRRFLTRGAATIAALAAERYARGMQATPNPIFGIGEHRYECIHDWLQPPDNIRWGYTHDVAQDSHHRIYVTHTVHPSSPSGDAVLVYDHNGKFLKSWGDRFRGGGHGIDIRREGHQEFIYHCDIAHDVVVKTTLDGDTIWEKHVPTESGVYKPGDPFVPTNVAFLPNGDFYVADGYGSNWIHHYDLSGKLLNTFGGTGTEPGKFRTAHGLWLDARKGDPTLVITDRSNHRIQWFSLDGKFIREEHDGMRAPCNFHFRGDLMLIPDLDSVVTILDGDNKVIAQLGDGYPSNLDSKPRHQWIPGKFIHPHGAKFLTNGDILVAEWVPIGRITLLKKVS